MQAVDQTVIHDIVHAAVSSDLFCLFLDRFGEFGTVSADQGIPDCIGDIVVPVHALDGNALRGVLVGKAL